MIHELDFLDIASYIIQPDETLNLSFKKLIKIKNILESQFASIEVDIDDYSIRRFEQRYSDFVLVHETSICITMTNKKYQELKKIRTPYLETEIIRLLKDEKL